MNKKGKIRLFWSKKILFGLVLLVLLTGFNIVLRRNKLINPNYQGFSNSLSNNGINIAYSGRYWEKIISFSGTEKRKYLRVDLEISVKEPSWYFFTASLSTKDNKLIAIGDLSTEIRAAPVTSSKLEIGTQVISLYFHGQGITSGRSNGPYLVKVFALSVGDDEGEAVTEAMIEFKTRPYKWYDFVVN